MTDHIEGLEQVYREALGGDLEGLEGPAEIKVKFKQLWPSVKQGLDLLRQLSGIVPGVGGIVKSVIGIVIAAGDAAFNAL